MTEKARQWCGIALCLALAGAVGAAPDSRSAYSGTIAKSSEFIRQALAEKNVAGATVALIEGETIVWQQGFGWSDKVKKIAVTPETVFHIGSVSKMLTTTAVLMLVDEGKVNLDAPVTKYIPDFRMRTGYESITVRQLLSHQSGIPGSYYSWGFTTAPVMDYNRRLLDWLSIQYPQYPPNYVSVYTNNGFTLADELVARVSGMPFAQFVRERITDPLGMTRTGVDFLDPNLAANLTKGYIDGEEQPPEYLSMLGTGGFSSTAADMCKLLAMFNGGGTAFGKTLLKASTVTEMNRDQAIGNPVRIPDAGLGPGLGWDEWADPGLTYAANAAAKDGSTILFGSQVITMPKYGLGVAVILNSARSDIARKIAEHILMDAVEERYGIQRPADIQVGGETAPGFDISTWTGSFGSVSTSGIFEFRVNGTKLDLWERIGPSMSCLYAGLSHRGSGWFAADEDPTTQFTVQNLGGRDVLMMRGAYGHYWLNRAVGDRLGNPPALSAAWKSRLGKTWIAADLDIAFYKFADVNPGILITQREGRLVYEAYDDSVSAGGSGADPLVRRLIERRKAATAAAEDLTNGSLVLEPKSDTLAWVPLQVDSRDLTHLQVIQRGQEEWLRVGSGPTLYRPLDGIPQPSGNKPYTANITPELTEWVKLPADAEYLLVVPDSVRWALYDDRLKPFYEAWGGAFRIGRPAGSKTSAIYLGLVSLSREQAVIQRLSGRTFNGGSGVQKVK